jgi:hypothetical protein
VGAEIGVAEGRNAESILQVLPMERLYLIDPYLPFIDGEKPCDPQGYYNIAQARLTSPKVKWLKMPSKEAASLISEKLDFVYIDGDHHYNHVKEDLELYYPLLKPKGLLGGHDYCLPTPGVIKAVNDFASEHGLELDFYHPDFWIVKP